MSPREAKSLQEGAGGRFTSERRAANSHTARRSVFSHLVWLSELACLASLSGGLLATSATAAIPPEPRFELFFERRFQRLPQPMFPNHGPSPFSGLRDPWVAYDRAWSELSAPNALPGRGLIRVAVLDTGLDLDHEDLSSLVPRDASGKVIGQDFTGEGAEPRDVYRYDLEGCALDFTCRSGGDVSLFLRNPGHGTHVSGHIAAVSGNGKGLTSCLKFSENSGVRILPFKIFGEQEGGSSLENATRAIHAALDQGAKVIHASWGARLTAEQAFQSEFYRAILRARDSGALIVAAAGNDGRNLDLDRVRGESTYPAAYSRVMDHVIAVGAIETGGETLARFSAFGPETVTIAAPGTRVLSTMISGFGNGTSQLSDADQPEGRLGYGDRTGVFRAPDGEIYGSTWDGTSMAAPFVTGAIAAAWSLHPDWTAPKVKRFLTEKLCRKPQALVGKVGCGTLDLSGLR